MRGGVLGVLAALKANYQVSGTVSYTAQHVNATVTYTKYKSTETSVQTTATITSAGFNQDGEPVVTNFVPTDSSAPKTVGSQDYAFSPEVVAYKVSLKIKNNGNFAIAASLTTPTPNAQNDNWFVHVVGQDSAENIAASTGEATIDVYLALTDLSKNVVQTNIEMSLNIEKSNGYLDTDGVLYNNSTKTVLLSYPQDITATSYTIPNTVTTIADKAFWGNTYLTQVTISQSVTQIQDNPFAYCPNIASFVVESGNPTYQVDSNGVLYTVDANTTPKKTLIVACPNAKTAVSNFGGTIYFYGDYKVTIGKYAYAGSKATSISLYRHFGTIDLTEISDYAFKDCTKLTEILIYSASYNGSPIILGQGVFDGTNKTNITVIYSTENTFVANGWPSEFTYAYSNPPWIGGGGGG